MIWLVPIGGKGVRTQALGEFKPFIEIEGQKMLTWALFSIKDKVLPQDTFIFTTTDYFRQKYHLEEQIKKIFLILGLNNSFKIFSSFSPLQGSSCSVYLAKEELKTKEPVLILNCDQYLDFELPPVILPQTAHVVLFADFGHDCGYAKVENNLISRFVEKNNISNLASAGVFIVSEAKALLWAIEKQFAQKNTTNGEFCITPTLNYLIEKGFQIHPLSAKSYYDLGSLAGIDYFSRTPLAKYLAKVLNQLEKSQPQKSSFLSYSPLTLPLF